MIQDLKLRQIVDLSEMIHKLNKVLVSKKTVLAWIEKDGQKVIADLKLDAIKRVKSELIFTPMGFALENLREITQEGQELKLYIPDEGIMIKSTVLKFTNTNVLYMKFPIELQQIERRQAFRLELDASSDVKIEFQKSYIQENIQNLNFNYKCFDISYGGISFLISKEELIYYSTGDVLKNISLHLDGDIMSVDGIVVNVNAIKGHGQMDYKISMAFELFNSALKYTIERYIFNRINFLEVA